MKPTAALSLSKGRKPWESQWEMNQPQRGERGKSSPIRVQVGE
jgi:hypothetical protein